MDLRDYLRIVRRNWIVIVATTLAGIICGGAMSLLARPSYTAETQLFVAIQSSGSVQELQQGNTFSQARVASYVKTATTPVVLQPAIDRLGLQTTPLELARKVKASTDLNTVLIKISVEDESPVQAAATAEAIASSLIKAVDTLERPKAGGSSPVNLSIITPAAPPISPTAPNVKLNLLLGAGLGLALGFGLAALRSTLDRRIRTEEDVRVITDLPILGRIAFDPSSSSSPLFTDGDNQSPRAESFRQLRTNLQFANIDGRVRTLLVTSTVPGEGKSTTAVNMAIALAQTGKRVCLVDADLRRPMLGEYLGLDNNAGLTTALVGAGDVLDLLHHWGDDELHVLTSGQVPPNPSELLGSSRMKELLKELEAEFDVILIDAPPLLPVTDAAILSRITEGVVLLIGAGRTQRQDLRRALDSLELIGARKLGVILNRLPIRGSDAYAYTYYRSEQPDSAEYTGRRRKPARKRNSSRQTQEDVGVYSETGRDDFDNLLIDDGSRAPSQFAVRRRGGGS
ncbi:polysaccharide biosynthesis tyrosine autokinase [Arthrobacter sp. efr-133-R2A-120]|uniref:polysaccharide biosynthesis tyrosine autokinase n=1 Tax=Arthrobacter sp. efr-133-R2A-120 TaxID=3040277 RepID=UPI00254FD5B3|nr:polysaccharide biosynthesis tyrosine autokinase [Arthrobacter sp. efr-133-R2A-120]